MNEHIVENIIVNIAREKYDNKINCHCEQKFNRTIIVDITEIKTKISKLNWINFRFSDIEYLFYDLYEINKILNKFCCNIFTKYDLLILKNLKKRIKYEHFSRYYIKAKKVYTSYSDSGVLLIVFELF